MLLPALQNARKMALRASCAVNVRQMALGFQMYLDHFNDGVPADDAHSRTRKGEYSNNAEIQEIYEYIGQTFHQPLRKPDGTVYNTGWTAAQNRYGSMRFDVNPVAVCPARPGVQYLKANASDPGWTNTDRHSYGLYLFVARDRRVTATRMAAAYNKYRQSRAEAGTPKYVTEPFPATFADNAVELTGSDINKIPINHAAPGVSFGSMKKFPEGGNVASLDGRVQWFGATPGVNQVSGTYTVRNANPTTGDTLPNNSFFMNTVGEGKLPDKENERIIATGSHTSAPKIDDVL